MQPTILFFQETPEDLENRIFQRFKTEFDNLKLELHPKQQDEFLTRSQVKNMLDVDLSTIHNWTKRGKLRAYGIGNRVYYKRNEVVEALKPLNL